MATILSKVLSGKWGAALKDTGKYVQDHPLAAAMVIGLGGYALAGGFAAAAPTLAAGTTVGGAGSAAVASTFPMSGVAGASGATQAAGGSGIANFLFGSPSRQFATGTATSVLWRVRYRQFPFRITFQAVCYRHRNQCFRSVPICKRCFGRCREVSGRK